MHAAITNRMCAFCDFINESKFLDWKLTFIDVVVIVVFVILH